MHKVSYVFADNAIDYVRTCKSICNAAAPEQDIDASSVSSFSSGVYSADDGDVESESSDEPQPAKMKAVDALKMPVCKPAVPRIMLSEEEEFGPALRPCFSILENESDSDSDESVPEITHHRIETLLKQIGTKKGSINVIMDENNRPCVVTQAEDYRFRSKELAPTSLFELACTCRRQTIKQCDNEGDNANRDGSDDVDSGPDEAMDCDDDTNRPDFDAPPVPVGRPPLKRHEFKDGHPLKNSHALTLQAKHSIPLFVKRVPPYPGKRPEPLTQAWKDKARKFAEFCLIVYKPWTGPDGLPECTTWRAFCDYVHELSESHTIISRTRLAYIKIAAHNLKFSAKASKIQKFFRGSSATRWLDMVKRLRPSAWLYGDETEREKNVPSKNSRQEAELAFQDLLHKISTASRTDTKRQQLLEFTVNSYKEAIGANVPLNSISPPAPDCPLFHDLPRLQDRLNCFVPDVVNAVHDHNITKQTDRDLQEKIKLCAARSSKRPKPKVAPATKKSPPPPKPDVWSPQQQKIVAAVSEFLDKVTVWKNAGCDPKTRPDSCYMLVFGGPGTGKTTVLGEISRLCEAAGVPLMASAQTGVAAGSMKSVSANTNHATFSLPVYQTGESGRNEFLPPLSQATISVLMERYQEALDSGLPLAVSIDEISMVDAITFGQILRRIEEFEGKEKQVEPPEKDLPRLFILVGDWFQIKPVRATSIYTTMLNNFVLDNPSEAGSPEDVGVRFFKKFRLFKLDIQYRSKDPQHSANLLTIRTFNPNAFPFTPSLISQYKTLTRNDVVKDITWIVAPVAVLYNSVRHAISMEGMKQYAKMAGFPVICWRNSLCGSDAAALTAAETNILFATHPALCGFFVPEMLCFGKDNIHTALGLFNGARYKMHSLTFDPDEDLPAFNRRITKALAGDTIMLDFPPLSVNVEVLDAKLGNYSDADSLVTGKFVAPILTNSKSRYESVKSWELVPRTGGKQRRYIKYRSIGLDLAFSITFDKTQVLNSFLFA